MGYAIRVTNRAVEVVTGVDESSSIVAAESSGVRVGLRGKWGGGELRSRGKSAKVIPQGSGWTLEGSTTGSPYASYAGTPLPAAYSPSLGVGVSPSPYLPQSAGSLPSYSSRLHSPSPGTVASGIRSVSSASPSLGPPRSAMTASFGPVSSMSTFPPSSTVATFGSSIPSTTTSEFEGSVFENGNGQDIKQPTTPGVAYARFPSESPQPAKLALPPTRGTNINFHEEHDEH